MDRARQPRGLVSKVIKHEKQLWLRVKKLEIGSTPCFSSIPHHRRTVAPLTFRKNNDQTFVIPVFQLICMKLEYVNKTDFNTNKHLLKKQAEVFGLEDAALDSSRESMGPDPYHLYEGSSSLGECEPPMSEDLVDGRSR